MDQTPPQFFLNPALLEQLEKLKLEDAFGTAPSSDNHDDASSSQSQEAMATSI